MKSFEEDWAQTMAIMRSHQPKSKTSEEQIILSAGAMCGWYAGVQLLFNTRRPFSIEDVDACLVVFTGSILRSMMESLEPEKREEARSYVHHSTLPRLVNHIFESLRDAQPDDVVYDTGNVIVPEGGRA
jgi:hypothetical protein